MIFLYFCAKLTTFRAPKMAIMQVSEILDFPKLISRKIWHTEKFCNIHTVGCMVAFHLKWLKNCIKVHLRLSVFGTLCFSSISTFFCRFCCLNCFTLDYFWSASAMTWHEICIWKHSIVRIFSSPKISIVFENVALKIFVDHIQISVLQVLPKYSLLIVKGNKIGRRKRKGTLYVWMGG